MSGIAGINGRYQSGYIFVYQCSGTGDCSNRVAVASNSNTYTDIVQTSQSGVSMYHTYQACFSVRFGPPANYEEASYSNYCTPVAAR